MGYYGLYGVIYLPQDVALSKNTQRTCVNCCIPKVTDFNIVCFWVFEWDRKLTMTQISLYEAL